MDEMIKLVIEGEEREYKKGITYREIASEYQDRYENDIVLVLRDNRLRELYKEVTIPGTLEFVTTDHAAGRKAYRRSLTLLLQKAIDNISGSKGVRMLVCHSISHGFFCRLEGEEELTKEYLGRVKKEMLRLCEADLPIKKHNFSTDEAIDKFRGWGMKGKERLFHYRRNSRINIYELDGYYDYFYGFMAPSTGYLKYFDLTLYEDGFVLLFPGKDPKIPAPFEPSHKLFRVLEESSEWGKMMGIGTIGEYNDAVVRGEARDIILVQEALMEKKIGQIAELIAKDKSKKFIMIAGPSSSGKTTFSHRLSIQLRAHGVKPHPIPLDDFYRDRIDTPLDEDGKPDFECLEALDVELFNKTMQKLLTGEQVELPQFNFLTGRSEYKGKTLKMGKDDVLVIEGIHGLNDQLSYSLPEESKFRIYISALTQLNIDEHNYIPTTDGRLIRRIVRDARARGTSAKDTIAMWNSVRRGEEKHIFPFQEKADVMFNSALIYELSVLKKYAEPLLFEIEADCPEYLEAKRLLKFLDYFLTVPTEGIMSNSIMREFIGGSCFPV